MAVGLLVPLPQLNAAEVWINLVSAQAELLLCNCENTAPSCGQKLQKLTVAVAKFRAFQAGLCATPCQTILGARGSQDGVCWDQYSFEHTD